jgi:hypothetical protein
MQYLSIHHVLTKLLSAAGLVFIASLQQQALEHEPTKLF